MSAALLAFALLLQAPPQQEQFRAANEAVRGGDLPKGIASYAALAADDGESASLYWNWSQAAAARGTPGEALWALLRARELEPADRALGREIERLRESANLDAAEIAPEPLAALRRVSRQWHLGALALLFGMASLALHAALRLRPGSRALERLPAAFFAIALLAAVCPVAATFARPTGVVVRRGAPILDSASATAEASGTLREGEVVPILQQSGAYLRIEDSSGARGWARGDDVRRLDRPPQPPS
jgi:hypothetical protein